ncbi:2,3-dihydroxybenzoate-AMP ligase [Catenulispora sp. MAP12-49]|uniref:(2,3-dihydroxybenzoyl)adenylate synthase n=1 Tax=Catenulispora sp. MAP12-49 TaxID=3156302 RepID=UPI0035186E73
MLTGCVPWPAEDAERYRRLGYWRGQALGDVLRDAVPGNEDRTALVSGREEWTFAAVDTVADRMAAGLHDLGLRPGDRVVVQLPNIPQFLTLSLALFRLGALPVYALPAHRASEIEYLCQMSDAVAYVVPGRYRGFDYRKLAREVCGRVRLEHVIVAGEPEEFLALGAIEAPVRELPAPDPGDVAFFLLSGGTTGLPKLIPRTHDDYAYQLRATAQGLGVGSGSAYLAALPVAHNAALGCPGVLGTYLAGGLTVLAGGAAPDEAFGLIARHRVTLTTLMPPLVKLWLDAAPLFDVDVSGVLLQIGSAKLPLEVARRIRPELGCEVTHWFGMAEGLLTYTRPGEPDDVVFPSTGRPMCEHDDEVKVVDADGVPVGQGEIGELVTRGPYTIRGYYRAEEHNARTFTADGWFHTGDLVRLTPAGDMVVEGRIKDVINRGGEKVSPAEVEDHLLAHPGVRDVSVVGVADEVLGEKSCAWVIAADGADAPLTLAELRRFLLERGVAAFKLPDQVAFTKEFPHTRVGKVNKAELARLATEQVRIAAF